MSKTIGYQDFRTPVEYIVDQKIRKLKLKDNVTIGDMEDVIDNLPEYPLDIQRNENNIVEKIIYAKGEELEWIEEFIRDENNTVQRIKYTLPHGYVKYVDLLRREDKKVIRMEENS